MNHRIKFLFESRRIAVIGASANESNIGGIVPRECAKHGFDGEVILINPRRAGSPGSAFLRDVSEIEGAIDLAVIAVPASEAPSALHRCVEKGVKAAVVFSSGFSEYSQEGRALEAQLSDIARNNDIALLGPNSQGCVNTKNGLVAAFTSAFKGTAEPGIAKNLAVLCQSGGVATHALEVASRFGLGISKMIVTGNEAALSFSDFLSYLADDSDTQGILAFLEGVADGAVLRAALQRVRQAGKPIVLIKVGTSATSKSLMQSHTASIAGDDAVYRKVFQETGAYRADSLNSGLDLAYGALVAGKQQSNRVGVVTMSGGFGSLAADLIEQRENLKLAHLDAATQREIKSLLPFSTAINPVDVSGQITNDFDAYFAVVDRVTSDPNVDIVIAYQSSWPAFAKFMATPWQAALRKNPEKTAIIVTQTATVALRRQFSEFGGLVFDDLNNAIDVANGLAEGASNERSKHLPLVSHDPTSISAKDARCWLEHELYPVLEAQGIHLPAWAFVKTIGDLASAAQRVGFPLVLKAQVPGIAHKSEFQLVRMSIGSQDDLNAAAHALNQRLADLGIDGANTGFLVSAMVDGAGELLISVRDDAVFGLVAALGIGGTGANAFRADTSICLDPLDIQSIETTVRAFQMKPSVRTFFQDSVIDIEGIAKSLRAMTRGLESLAGAATVLEVNPFIVSDDGKRLIAVDAFAA